MSLVTASSSDVKTQKSVFQSLLQACDNLPITAKSVAVISAAVILHQTEPTIRDNCLTIAAVALTCSSVSKLSSVFHSTISQFVTDFHSTIAQFVTDLNELGDG